jgi:hypothetical protein
MDSGLILAIQRQYNDMPSNSENVQGERLEAATPISNADGGKTNGLYHSNQVAAFDISERQAAFAARFMNCINRAFYAVGASPSTLETVFWKLSETRNLARNEIVDKPMEFIEGLETIYGEAGVVVFQYMLSREIKREFHLSAASEKEVAAATDLPGLLHLLAYVTLESQGASPAKAG